MLDLNPIKKAHQNVVRELANARAEQEDIANRIEALQAEARGLELYISRHSGQDSDEATDRQQISRWRRMSRTTAVEAVLEEADQPLGAAEITRVLHDQGRDDPRDHVASTLAYLKGKGRVDHHEAQGKYSKDTVSPGASSLGFEGGGSP